MSYFASEFADDDLTQVTGCEEQIEVAEGVVVERRSVLWLSAGSVAALLLGGRPVSAQPPLPHPPGSPEGLSFEQFLAESLPLARRLVESQGADEEAYLMTIAAAVSRLREPGAPLRDAMRAFIKAEQRPGERFPLSAVSLRLEPGRGFSHHDHFNYNGVIMGLEGEVRIRNYDPVEPMPELESTKTFGIRQTRDDLILPGRFSTLGRSRENIHDLVAGKDGGRVIDVFTFFAKGATSRYLEVDPKPRDAAAGIFEAAWKPRERR